jgi:beta-1,4-mannosyl-glycoprotein beta-1,4-N-acetylglucosaminyltransferase
MKTSFASKEIYEKLKADNTKYRLVILIIASISESYNLFVECWKEYMTLFPDVKAYFLYSDPTIETDIMVYDNLILYKGQESAVPGIFQKTVSAMNFCQKYISYEYLIRTNLSTFLHVPRLLDYLSDKPNENFVAGHYNQLPLLPNQILKQTMVNTYLKRIVDDKFIYMHGTGILFSADIVTKFLAHVKSNYEKIQKVFELPDDVLISVILYDFLTFDENVDDADFYRPKEFLNFYEHKLECSALIEPQTFDNDTVFLIRNKILTESNNVDIETRYNDIMNYIHQIRYFYNKPTFMDYIDEPPKKKVVDAFIFYNELDMLEYRLNVLADTVDHFVLVESTKTFMGFDKPLYYAENKERFSKFNDKIVHIVVDNFIVPNVDKNEQWNNEAIQRNHIHPGIVELELEDYDYILISDIDEIPDPKLIHTYKTSNSILPFANLKQEFFYYNLHHKMNEIWIFPKLITYQEYVRLGSVPHKIRNLNAPTTLDKSGWHLSYFGDVEYIKNKIQNFSHQEYNTAEITDESLLQSRIKNGEDILNRQTTKIKRVDIDEHSYLPPKYKEFLSKYIDDLPTIEYELDEIPEAEVEVEDKDLTLVE